MNNDSKRFREIVTEMADLYEKKNANYGNSFSKLYSDLGPVAGLVPLHNKLDRATNIVKGGANNFESLEDTFKDLACYAVMNLLELERQKKLSLESTNSDLSYDNSGHPFDSELCSADSLVGRKKKILVEGVSDKK